MLTSYDDQSMLYDNSGNLIECGSRAFGWTEHNQLSTIAEWYRDEEGNRVRRRIDFTYDTAGIRTSKTVDGVTTEYFYVGDKLVKQSTEGKPENDLYFSYSADGSPFKVKYLYAEFFYLLNLQGDVIGLYDSAGDMIVTYVYDSWGKLISAETHDPVYEELAELNPLRYRGYYYDNETQLYYLQARYYNPEWGRFINADSLLVAGDYLQGLNRYAYCLNNPICYSDPSGYSATDAAIMVVNMMTILVILSYFYDEAFVGNDEAFIRFWNSVNVLKEVSVDGKTLFVTDSRKTVDNLLKIYMQYEDSKVLNAASKMGTLFDIADWVTLGGLGSLGTIATVVFSSGEAISTIANPLLTTENKFESVTSTAIKSFIVAPTAIATGKYLGAEITNSIAPYIASAGLGTAIGGLSGVIIAGGVFLLFNYVVDSAVEVY